MNSEHGIAEEDPDADTKETVPPATDHHDNGTGVREEDPDADTKETAPSGASNGQNVVEEDPDADTKPSGPNSSPRPISNVRSAAPSYDAVGKLGVVQCSGPGERDNSVVFPAMNTTMDSLPSGISKLGVPNGGLEGDNSMANGSRMISGNGSLTNCISKLGVASGGPELDNSLAAASNVVVEDADADTKETAVKEVDADAVTKPTATRQHGTRERVGSRGNQSQEQTDEVHRVVLSYPLQSPERLTACFPKEKVNGDGSVVFGRLAPKAGVKIKLNDLTISKKQFSLNLNRRAGEFYFDLTNMSSSKPMILNGETLMQNDSRRLPRISHLRIPGLDPEYGEGQNMDFLVYTETFNRSGEYKFDIEFKADPYWETNYNSMTRTEATSRSTPCAAQPPAVVVDFPSQSGTPYSASQSWRLPLMPTGMGSPLPHDLIGLNPQASAAGQLAPPEVQSPGGLSPDGESRFPIPCSSPNISPMAPRRARSGSDDAFAQHR